MVVHESQSTRPLDTSIGMASNHLHGKPVRIARFKSKPMSIVFFTFCKQSPVFLLMACDTLMREGKEVAFFCSLFFFVRRQNQCCVVINV